MGCFLLLGLMACSAAAFTATPLLPSRAAVARPAPVASPTMVVEPSSLDSSLLLALQLPIPAFTPAKSILMMFCNLLIICTMSIQGKGLSRGTPHDEMVEEFGITWLLAGTSLGHIVGAGAILGCQTAGFL